MVFRSLSSRRQTRGFTLLEIALIVAIIGMMLLIIVGYLLAPKNKKKLHPLPPKEVKEKVEAATPQPATKPVPVATPAAAATAVPADAATPQPKTIELTPNSVPAFR